MGLRDHRVGDGPNRLRALGVLGRLKSLGLTVKIEEIDRVDDFEGEIGRSFEVLRRTSNAVARAVANDSFPLVLSGNCMASVGVACGLAIQDLGFIYFDAHDDMDTPSTNTNGYFDAMGLSMLAGKSWNAHTKTINGFEPREYNKFVYCGLRDTDQGQQQTVLESGADVIWGNVEHKVDFVTELTKQLKAKDYSPALVHLDLDVLDKSEGMVNGFESSGGISGEDLVHCLGLVPELSAPTSLTVCSFNPNLGDGDKIATIGIDAIVAFFTALVRQGFLEKSQ